MTAPIFHRPWRSSTLILSARLRCTLCNTWATAVLRASTTIPQTRVARCEIRNRPPRSPREPAPDPTCSGVLESP